MLSSTGTFDTFPLGVGELLGLLGWLFELSPDAEAERSFLVVAEHDLPIEGRERRDPVDAARVTAAAEDEARRFAQERRRRRA